MKTSVIPSRIFRGAALGLVVIGLSLAGRPARAQSTAGAVKSGTDRDTAFQAELASLFDVRAPHGAAKKTAAGACKRCAACAGKQDQVAAGCPRGPAGSLPQVTAKPDTLAAEVADLFDVRVPAKATKNASPDKQ